MDRRKNPQRRVCLCVHQCCHTIAVQHEKHNTFTAPWHVREHRTLAGLHSNHSDFGVLLFQESAITICSGGSSEEMEGWLPLHPQRRERHRHMQHCQIQTDVASVAPARCTPARSCQSSSRANPDYQVTNLACRIFPYFWPSCMVVNCRIGCNDIYP